MSYRPSIHVLASLLVIALVALACGGGEEKSATAPKPKPSSEPQAQAEQAARAVSPSATPDDLDQALVLSLAQFQKGMKPGAARLEFLVRRDGRWDMVYLEDSDSNVFHKAMAYEHGGETQLLTVAGTGAFVKLWSKAEDGSLGAETLWTKDFGGKFSRMRDVEIGNLFGDGRPALAVATHDAGVVATIHPRGASIGDGFQVTEIDAEEKTFVHEIEIGDLDGDGILEVYATPSEPNRLDGSVQKGFVARYVPKQGEGRAVVADLGERHAKEIYVEDMDGDGVDELYVVVEGKKQKGARTLDYPVEIRRYGSGADPTDGTVIATIQDQLCRFLTSADVDGDGTKELVTASFSSGVFLLRPRGEGQKWRVESVDRDSGGFEHATIAADLDGDGKDELYVASDKAQAGAPLRMERDAHGARDHLPPRRRPQHLHLERDARAARAGACDPGPAGSCLRRGRRAAEGMASLRSRRPRVAARFESAGGAARAVPAKRPGDPCCGRSCCGLAIAVCRSGDAAA